MAYRRPNRPNSNQRCRRPRIRDADGRFWIIDFKISDHQGAHLDRFLEEEQRRYHPQLDSYATLISRLEPGPISLGLYFPLLDAWREWTYDAEAITDAVAPNT